VSAPEAVLEIDGRHSLVRLDGNYYDRVDVMDTSAFESTYVSHVRTRVVGEDGCAPTTDEGARAVWRALRKEG
jgi:hypothetical protein